MSKKKKNRLNLSNHGIVFCLCCVLLIACQSDQDNHRYTRVKGRLLFESTLNIKPGSVALVVIEDSSNADRVARVLSGNRVLLSGHSQPLPFNLALDTGSLDHSNVYELRAKVLSPEGTLFFAVEKTINFDTSFHSLNLGNITMVSTATEPDRPVSSEVMNQESVSSANRFDSPEAIKLKKQVWMVKTIDHKPVLEDSRITISFDEGLRVYGRGGCNSYDGSYDIRKTAIRIGNLIATQMACEPNRSAQEQVFFQLLPKVTQYRFNQSGHLVLMTEDDEVIMAQEQP